MITAQGIQCDVHDAMLDAKAELFLFKMPPSQNFPGIAAKTNSKQPATLVACKDCWPKVLFAMKTKNMAGLPEGRFRGVMLGAVALFGAHNIRFKVFGTDRTPQDKRRTS